MHFEHFECISMHCLSLRWLVEQNLFPVFSGYPGNSRTPGPPFYKSRTFYGHSSQPGFTPSQRSICSGGRLDGWGAGKYCCEGASLSQSLATSLSALNRTQRRKRSPGYRNGGGHVTRDAGDVIRGDEAYNLALGECYENGDSHGVAGEESANDYRACRQGTQTWSSKPLRCDTNKLCGEEVDAATALGGIITPPSTVSIFEHRTAALLAEPFLSKFSRKHESMVDLTDSAYRFDEPTNSFATTPEVPGGGTEACLLEGRRTLDEKTCMTSKKQPLCKT